ncbi:MAG: hypothetical protein AB7V02_01115 [Parvularculaceae bacterium]
MSAESEIERDTIDWFRIGVAVAANLAGLFLYFSGNRPAAYIVLGYALFGAIVMIVFGSWRGSTEVARVRKRQWNRYVQNIPRNIIKWFLGFVVMAFVLAIGIVPFSFISNEFYSEHEHLFVQWARAYSYALIGISLIAFLWVAGFISFFRGAISDFKDMQEAVRRAKKRRAKEKGKLQNLN